MVFNTNGHRLAVRKRQLFLDRAPGDAEVEIADVAKEDKKSIVWKRLRLPPTKQARRERRPIPAKDWRGRPAKSSGKRFAWR